jgi:hypothetical protein
MKLILIGLAFLCGCGGRDISYSPKTNPDFFIGKWSARKDTAALRQIWNFPTNKDLVIIFPNEGVDTCSYWVETSDEKKFLLLQSKAKDSNGITIFRIEYSSKYKIGLHLFAYRQLDSVGKFWVERPMTKPYNVNIILSNSVNY